MQEGNKERINVYVRLFHLILCDACPIRVFVGDGETILEIAMTQKNVPGYPLPDGELGDDEIVCQLVYLPNRDEYWQALLAAVHYLSTWRAWKRDTDKRGQAAAANWREAFELTIGCWRMACLDELTQDVNDILELLQAKKDCCDDNITYLPTPEITTDIEPNVGDPPEEYGETEVEDWDEWLEHVCYNANLYVDYLAHAGDTMFVAFAESGIVIGLIAALLALLAASGIGLPISFALSLAVTSGIIGGGTLATFAGSEDAIEDARNAIVCAILQGRSLSAAVETALESGLDWDLFYQFIDYDSALSIIYEGGYAGDFLPSETSDSCVCICEHMLEVEVFSPVTIIYQHSAGAEWEFGKRTTAPFDGHQICQMTFNSTSEEKCGPMKVIDSISVDDALLFTRIITYDLEGGIIDDYYDNGLPCTENISQLVGDTLGSVWLQRAPIAGGGCAQVIATVTLTWHHDI